MKLNRKTLLTITTVWLVFMIFAYAGSRAVLFHTFLSMEQQHVNRHLSHLDRTLSRLSKTLAIFTAGDTIANNDISSDVVHQQLKRTANLDFPLNLLTYWDKSGQLIVGAAIDTDTNKSVALPSELGKHLNTNSSLFTQAGRGYILLGNKIMLVAAHRDKIANGASMVVAGRYLTAQLIRTTQDSTAQNIELFTLPEIEDISGLNQIFTTLANNSNNHVINLINDQEIESFTLIKDVNGLPIGMIRLEEPRTIYQAGLQTIHYFLTAFVLLGLAFAGLLVWLMRTTIIKRLEKLDRQIADIITKRSTTERVTITGNDEITTLSSEINTLLDNVQASREELERRAQQYSQDLINTNAQLQQNMSDFKVIEKEWSSHKEQITRLAHYDSVTSLPNQVLFNEIFNKSLRHADRQEKMLAVLFIDLDQFKKVNDDFGHSNGDLVLKEIALRFSSVIRAGDNLARLSGDEYVILLNDIAHPKFAGSVADKLLQACAKPIKISGQEITLSASIGICVFPNDGMTLEDLYRNADIAIYKAKRSGGGIFQYFTKELNEEAHQHMELEAALRKAVETKAFRLFYQPKLNLLDGTLSGVEALLRWDDPVLGSVSPTRFIPLAEENGLIMKLGAWALREACRANKSWQNQGYAPITMSVNLSAKQFSHPDLSQLIAAALEDSGLQANYLEVEITETAIMENVKTAISQLNEIKNLGVKIALDDFGTGYTSISYLKQFPISTLKIDQSFIKGIPTSQNDMAITGAIIAMAHNLGLEVVAEGVETTEQISYLAEHRCDVVQGYFMSRPLSETKMALQLSQQRDIALV